MESLDPSTPRRMERLARSWRRRGVAMKNIFQKLLALVKVGNVVEEAARMGKESDKTMEEKRKEAAEKVEIV